MGIGKKITKGSMGGGVNISHNSKMSQSAKNQMSFPGGMPGPGNYGSTNNNVVGKGMAQYMAGEAVGMKKYGAHKGTAKMDPMHNGEPGVQKEDFEQFSAPKSTGPGKYTRLDKTKAKAKDAKEAAEKTSNDSGITVKGTRQGLKADRLARRQKRQEGRAERKNIRKKAKEGKIIDGKSGEYNAMSKKEKIKASRKKQKAKDPVVKKLDGPAKTDPVIVKGDKSKVNDKVTKTNLKADKIAKLKELKKVKRQALLDKIEEKRNMIQVKKDLKANIRNQKKRERDGKDYQSNTGTDNQKTIRRS